MEKNIHNDHLDDYVRKSFEDYEENPASDMWGRIEEELPPVVPEPVVRPGIGSIRRYFWQMSAAAAILLLISSLVCGRLYYENKIRERSAVQQNTQGTAPQKPVPPPYPAVPVAPHTASETQNPKPQSLNPVSQTVVPQSGPGNTSNRNIADKVENHVSFFAMYFPLGVGGMDKRRSEILKLMAMPSLTLFTKP